LNLIRIMPAKGETAVETSIFIARLLGPAILLAGLSLIAHPAFYRAVANEVQGSRGLLYLFGMIRFVAGLAVVLVHNVWTADWRTVVTLIGWAAMLRGALILAMPEQVLSWTRRALAREVLLPVSAAVAIAVGGALCFFGYL
jgi:hypothetical protein